jgi:hypothetical protein
MNLPELTEFGTFTEEAWNNLTRRSVMTAPKTFSQMTTAEKLANLNGRLTAIEETTKKDSDVLRKDDSEENVDTQPLNELPPHE